MFLLVLSVCRLCLGKTGVYFWSVFFFFLRLSEDVRVVSSVGGLIPPSHPISGGVPYDRYNVLVGCGCAGERAFRICVKRRRHEMCWVVLAQSGWRILLSIAFETRC